MIAMHNMPVLNETVCLLLTPSQPLGYPLFPLSSAARKCLAGGKIQPKETFEAYDADSVSSTGWANAKLDYCDEVGDNYIVGNFLGPYGNLGVMPSKTFVIPLATANLKLEFDFYALASWDFPSDMLRIKLNDQKVNLSPSLPGSGSLVHVARGDRVHKDACFLSGSQDHIVHYTLTIPSSVFAATNTLKVTFIAKMELASQEGAGFDNIMIKMVNCRGDPDQDGITSAADKCLNTKIGAAHDSNGCSGAQIVAKTCPCNRPACRNSMNVGLNGGTLYKTYWKCVRDQANLVNQKGLIAAAEKQNLITAARACQCQSE